MFNYWRNFMMDHKKLKPKKDVKDEAKKEPMARGMTYMKKPEHKHKKK
jgi:hypothetical protein